MKRAALAGCVERRQQTRRGHVERHNQRDAAAPKPPCHERQPLERRRVPELQVVDRHQYRRQRREPSAQVQQIVVARRGGDGGRPRSSSSRRARANGKSRSPSSPRAASTVSRWAAPRAQARSSRTLRPLPAGPATITSRPQPARATRTARSIAATSAPRSRSRSDTERPYAPLFSPTSGVHLICLRPDARRVTAQATAYARRSVRGSMPHSGDARAPHQDRRHAGPRHRRARGARPARRGRHGLRAPELLARHARGPAPARRRGARRGRAGRPPGRPAVRPPGPEAAPVGRHGRARWSRATWSLLRQRRRSGARRASRVAFDKFAALVTERSEIVIGDGVPRFAVERDRGPRVVARARLPRAAVRRARASTSLRPARAAGDHREGHRRPRRSPRELGADFVALSFVRSAADIEQLRTLVARARLARAGDREDREDRGLRGARRDHRRRRRR